MSQNTPLTTENLKTINDGDDRLTTQDAPSVSGRSATPRRRSGRFPVDTGEYRRGSGTTGHNPRDSQSSSGPSNQDLYDTGRDDGPNEGDTTAPTQTTGSERVTERTARRSGTTESTRAATTTRAVPRTISETPEDAQAVAQDYNLNVDQQALLAELIEINGQDSYDALSAGIGKLKKDEYLRLPNNVTWNNVPPRDVGKPVAHRGTAPAAWAQVYVLNKEHAPDGSDPVVYGFLRMEAVKAGWYDNQREVVLVSPAPDAVRIMVTDFATVRDKLERIKTAAFIVPLVAEHVFRTMGHHYITSDSATYTGRYADTFRSCLLPDIAGLLPPAVLYHAALHWVSPRRSREVLVAQSGTPSIPDALAIRANAAPAGTAILTTTAAIIDAMAAVGLAQEFSTHGGFDLGMIQNLTAVIKAKPTRYHKSYFAYGVTALDEAETASLERGKAEAIRFAPYAQAFINTLLREAALGRAKALAKHADANPIQMRRASNFFRALTRKEVTSVATLFDATVSARDVE